MPLILRRPVLLPAVLALLTIFQPWSRESRAEDPDPAATTPTAASAAPLPVVRGIDVFKSLAGTRITISGEGKLAYEYFVIGGRNLLIDIPGASSSVLPAERQVDDEFVSRIQVAAQTGDTPGVRVALDLKRPDDFTIRGENGRIVVWFATRKDGVSANRPPPNRVVEITATRVGNAFRVAVKTDAQPSYRVLESNDPKRITVAIDGSRLEHDSPTISDSFSPDSPVTRISSWSEPEDPPVVLVAIDLRQPLPFRVFTDGYGLNVDFTGAVSGGTESVQPPPISPALTPGSALPVQTAPAATAPASVFGKYTGTKITLEFIDADITDIFRLIADVSGMNIVATEDVKGRRSVKMTEIPWDQALDLILKTNIPQLVQIGESDTVIRVTTQLRMFDEQTAIDKRRLDHLQRALAEEEQKAELSRRIEAESRRKVTSERQRSTGWRERTFAVSYSDTKEVATRLEKFYSGCPDGCVFESGERSKTIFVRDFVDNIEQMNSVFVALESPTAAVMVEARIVEVFSDYAEAIGIQWGATYIADAAHGNATQYAFPNSIAIAGTEGAGAANYLVNLPVAGAVGGVGIALGHIANTFALDIKLSALEKLGKSKILSNPKVLVIQNEEANINVGQQLPVLKTDTEGSQSVDWKDVGIVLTVTPNVTSDGRVFMKVKIEKSSRGPDVKTTEGEMFSINRRGAETKVLVADGETAVIGGIFEQRDETSDDGVPGFSRIPLFGWLFKTRSSGNSRSELMIFLTPRIVNTTVGQR